MKPAILSIFAIMMISLACTSAFDDGVVVEVGSLTVSVNEMRSRFAVTPYFGKFPEDDQQTKLLALASLIGEKLLASEAQLAGLDQSETALAVAKEFEKEAVIERAMDVLFSGINITPEQVKQALHRSQRSLDVEEMVFDSRPEAERATQNLQPAEKSLGLLGVLPGEISKYSVKWGDVDPQVEEILWNLPPGIVSSPVVYKGHFYLFNITRVHSTPVSRGDLPRVLPQIRTRLEGVAKRRLYDSYYAEVMTGKQTRVPAEKLTYIAEQIELALAIPSSEQRDSASTVPVLMPPEYYIRAREQLQNRLDEPFIEFDDGSTWTIGDFLSILRHGPYPLNYSSRALFRASLRNMAIMMMEQEYIARDGYDRGLADSPEVRTQRDMWVESYLADQMRLQVVRAGGSKGVEPEEPHKAESFQSSVRQTTERRDALDGFLARAMTHYRVKVNHALLDTLTLKHLKMIVYKRHFPGRQAAPSILPFDRLPKYFALAMGALRQ